MEQTPSSHAEAHITWASQRPCAPFPEIDGWNPALVSSLDAKHVERLTGFRWV